MSKDTEISNELTQVMANALLQLQKLVNSDLSQTHDFLSIVNTFLLGVVSTAVDRVELNLPGSAPLIYADVEAAAKLGGLRAIISKPCNQPMALLNILFPTLNPMIGQLQ